MTLKEKLIVSAYTGYLMCDMSEVHKYIEELLGRPVWSHELANPDIQAQIQEKSREAFLKLCNTQEDDKSIGFACKDEEPLKQAKITDYDSKGDITYYECPHCGSEFSSIIIDHFKANSFEPHCPSCGNRFKISERDQK